MPAAWIGAGAAVYGALNSGGGGSNINGAGNSMYVPTGLGYADQGWQGAFGANQAQLGYGGYGGGTPMQPNYWGSPLPQGVGGGGFGGGFGGEQQDQRRTGGMGMSMTSPDMRSAMGMSGAPGQQVAPGGGADWYPGSDQMQGGGAQQGGGQMPQQQQQGGYYGGGGLAGLVDPAIYQSFAQSQNINYSPYLQASQQAGQQFGNLAGQTQGIGQGMMGEGAYAFGQQGQLGQAGQDFYGRQQRLGGQSQSLGYGQLGQSQGLASPLQGAGQQVFNTAFDPQQQLYDRTRQQVQDQSNSVASQFGLGSSAAGAGMTDQALGNFNIDWQNSQLARQSQGLGAMTGANSAASGILGAGYGGAQQGVQGAGSLGYQGISGYDSTSRTGGGLGALGNASYQGAQGMFSQVPGYTQQSAGVPMSAQQMVAGMPGQNAAAYASGIYGAMSPYNQQMNQAIPYMNYGSGAGANAAQQSLNQQKFAGQQMNSAGQALGQVDWSKIGNWFGGGGGGTVGSGIAPGGDGGYDAYGATDYSDRRLKSDVELLARRDDGLGVYRFRYVWGGPLRIGFMADEVEKVYPEAVSLDPLDFKMVDYSMVPA